MPHEAKSPTDKIGKMGRVDKAGGFGRVGGLGTDLLYQLVWPARSEEHTSELQSR